ncbi:Aldose 1-epimerase [Corynebacterium massiliense DSM 45435]|uniref:Aldose 1-epimerase n=1 Tax=Corynebacterium massiliense DSM 45435 TaxID=1121364 RepID=A0ABY7U885_9CORY|nr:Aldose 1-epimerase [Corynebacterium massiliense DSM 45435]
MNLWLQKVDAKLNNLTPVYTIRADGYAAQIAAFGGGVKSLTFRGAPLVETYDGFPPLAAGVVLAPWPNRIADGTYTWRGERHQLPITEPERNNAIHGFVADRVWECVSHSVGSVTLAVNIAPQAGYPWFVRLVARYALGRDGLTATFHAESPHPEVPYAFGWHTYLTAGGAPTDTCRLTLNTTTDVELDGARNLPTGVERPAQFKDAAVAGLELDHCFSAPTGVRAELADAHGLRTRLECSGDVRWAQVYTPHDYPGRGRAIAVEPMSAPPNAFATGTGVRTLPATDWVRLSAADTGTAADTGFFGHGNVEN